MKIFPPFRLDPLNQCLWRNEERILLAPKVFAILQYLVENAGRLVSQEEIMDGLWKDTFVQPEVLRKYILEIRRALDDPPKNPRFIATFPKRGYQFIAHVSDLANTPITKNGADPHWHFNGAARGLVGRNSAMGELNRSLDSALRGHRQVIFITGEPGIGKTTLADAFQAGCESRPDLIVARGQCMEGFGGKEAYYPVLDALGQWMRGPDSEAVVETLLRLAPTWLVQFPGLVKPETRAALQTEILGATRERMVREFCEAVESLAAQRPVALILEDLHWVDSSTLDLISALGRRRGPAKLMLVATYRPVEVILSGSPLRKLKQDLLMHRLCREIALERLTPGEVEEFLAARFPGSGVTKALAAPIHRRSDGNPLFMVALVDQLLDKGFIQEEQGRWLVTERIERLDPDLPETLRQMVETQIEHLGAHEKSVLRAASVAGQRFSAWAVGAALGEEPNVVEEACENLTSRQQLLRPCGAQEIDGEPASTQYEFRHFVYRELLYGQLPPRQKAQFHLKIAMRMESLIGDGDRPRTEIAFAGELASHFQSGHDYQRAIRYLILTAGNAQRRYAHAEAVGLLRHALDLLPNIPADSRTALEIQILEKISDALYAQGELDQSGDIDRTVADLAGQAGLKAAQVNALTRLARILAFHDPERCITLCERALEVSRTHDDPLLEARTEMLTASWRVVTHGWTEADARNGESARDRIRALTNGAPAYYEILYAHVECAMGRYEDACRTAQDGIASSVQTDNLVVYLSAHSSLAHALLHLGKWGDLLRVIAAAQNAVEKNGNAPWRGIFQGLQAWLRYQACDFEGAARLADTLLTSHTEEPAGQVRTMAMVTRGFAYLSSGSPELAEGMFAEVSTRQLRPRFFMDWYWRKLARLGLCHALLNQNRDAEASTEAAALAEAVRATADPALKAALAQLEARMALRHKDWDRARDALDQAFALLRERPVPTILWRLHATAVDLYCKNGDSAAAAEHRARAAAIAMELARSIPADDPLRAAFIGSEPVRFVTGDTLHAIE